jgi:dihydrofolate synthase/folylpolyglutamate synthase
MLPFSDSDHPGGSPEPARRRLSPLGPPPRWTQAEAEHHLRSLELFGMRFGLERMRRMMTALGSPQRQFHSLHVLGTNGKTSTTRMTAAILERYGVRTGAYTSPHLISYRERVQIGEVDIEGDAFAAAVARAAWAAERVNRTLSEDDHVTQFELLTAAAFCAMAERGVQVAVVEAGLGGRYDATSVIDSSVTVLTNIGLEHTRWLGPTLHDIAEEKLAVVRPDTTLVLGPDLAAPALAVARRVAAERGARIVHPAEPHSPWALRARGSFQQRNFALARTAAEAYLRGARSELAEHAAHAERLHGAQDILNRSPRARAQGDRSRDVSTPGADGRELEGGGWDARRFERAVEEAGASTVVAGRMQVVDEDPLTVLDGAHNPDAVAALVESLPEVVGDRPLGLVLGVLEDKDAAGMLVPLLARCERAWFTAPASSRTLSPAALQSLARQRGFDAVACEPRPDRALSEAQRWARARGGAVLATGSVYLVGDLLARLDGGDNLSHASQAHPRSAIR